MRASKMRTRKRDAAQAKYNKVTAPAYAEYKEARATAMAECAKQNDAAWAAFERVTAPALAELEKALKAIDAEGDVK